MVKRKMVVQVSRGRVSKSLGTDDPRLARTLGSGLQPDLNLGRSLRIDSRGRMAVNPAAPVKRPSADYNFIEVGGVTSAPEVEELSDTLNAVLHNQAELIATYGDVINTLNELISGQVGSGQMKGV
jgi:hypothetical protein